MCHNYLIRSDCDTHALRMFNYNVDVHRYGCNHFSHKESIGGIVMDRSTHVLHKFLDTQIVYGIQTLALH